MDNGASSYRRFRDNGDQSGLVEIIRVGRLSWGKESACQRRRHGFDHWVRKIPWSRKWQIQYSCLGNPVDRGTWQATVHEVAKTWTQLSN